MAGSGRVTRGFWIAMATYSLPAVYERSSTVAEKIAPQEVDNVLMEHPAVAQAVTFAVPHARLGEDIAAAVVLHQNAMATEHDIRLFIATRLAAFKVPQQVYIVERPPEKPYRQSAASWFGRKARPDGSRSGTATMHRLTQLHAHLWRSCWQSLGSGARS